MGSETWRLRKDEINRLQAFEMWIWRKMEKISWKDKMTNEQVFRDSEGKGDAERRRKKKWIGHDCVERKLTFERNYRRKAPLRKKASNDDDMKEEKELDVT